MVLEMGDPMANGNSFFWLEKLVVILVVVLLQNYFKEV